MDLIIRSDLECDPYIRRKPMASRHSKQRGKKIVTPSLTGKPNASISEHRNSKLPIRHIWIFRLAAGIVAPLLFWGLLEGGLYLGGYGYPTNFYIGAKDRVASETNPKFGWRFFPPSLARSPIPSFLSDKPSGTIRIFVLGDSAAQGVPNPEFGVGRILKVMLQHRYPALKFEVINAAMTAINSHVTRAIADDCAAHQPDLFIVYMGNNEVIGPFGPGTVFQSWIPNLHLIRANLWVKSTRTGQLLDHAGQLLRPHDQPAAWRGMEMFLDNPVAANDPRLAAVYENFRRNLIDICRIGRQAGAAVILSTVAVNLKDCPPFASQHRASFPPEALKNWASAFKAGIDLEAKKEWRQALSAYESAAKQDADFAELQFRMGRCLEAEGKIKEAREHFQSARDHDVLRFRADTQINRIIREVAALNKKDAVYGADAERFLTENDKGEDIIAGDKVFFEHVHFTFTGNYLLARLMLDQVEAALPQLRSSQKTGTLPDLQQCARFLALTTWDESQMAASIVKALSRPPFTNQIDNASRMAALKEQANSLAQLASMPEAFQNDLRIYEAALKNSPDDWILHRRFGKLMLDVGELKTAALHLDIARDKYPGEPAFFNDLGDLERQTGRKDSAIQYYRQAIEMNPQNAPSYANLAIVLAGSGRTDEALKEFQRALQINPAFSTAQINYAGLLASLGRLEEAIVEYQKAVTIDSENSMAHYGLAMALTNRGRISEGIEEYQKALKIKPNFPAGHINLGNALAGQGQTGEALFHFRKALEINPRDAVALFSVGKVLAIQGQTDEAIASLRRALEIRPNYGEADRLLQSLIQ
jgi:tetratricopeptide (TPR) repeat protein